MKTIIIGIACVLGILGTQAQETNNRRTAQSVQQELDILFIVKTTSGNEFTVRQMIVDMKEVDSLVYLNTTQVDSIFGKSSIPRAVVVAHINPSVNLLDTQQLLAHYNIPKKHWSLPLKMNGKKIKEPGTLLADTNLVHSIRVENNGAGAHIAVLTKHHLEQQEKEQQEKQNRGKP